MTAATKFTFDTHFDSVDPRNVKAESRSRRSYSAEEIDNLRREAREDGRKDGDVRASQAIAASLGQLAAALHAAIEGMDEEIERIRAEAAVLAFAAARKLAGAALASAPDAEVAEALRIALHQAMGEPRVVVKTAPLIAEKIQARANEIAQAEGYDGRVQFVTDEGLAEADCRIEWHGGGLERTQSAIENALGDLIARRFPSLSERKA